MNFVWAFIIGGILCAIAQVLVDKTKMTMARILVLYVCLGVLLTLVGVYEPLVKFAGAGATVPLSGFGYALAKGVMKAVDEKGLIGILTGGLTATAGGVTAAIIFSYIAAILCKPKAKN